MHALSANCQFVQVLQAVYLKASVRGNSIMKKTIHYEFEQGTVLSLRSIAGRTLRVVSGQVWLTESAQRTDIVMEPGGFYQPVSNRLVVLEALRDARIELDLPSPSRSLHFLTSLAQRISGESKRFALSGSQRLKKIRAAPSLG